MIVGPEPGVMDARTRLNGTGGDGAEGGGFCGIEIDATKLSRVTGVKGRNRLPTGTRG